MNDLTVKEVIRRAQEAVGINENDLDLNEFSSVLEAFDKSVKQYANLPVFTNLGHSISYKELDKLSTAFAAFIQNKTSLEAGDRFAIQLVNCLQYPVALFGAMKAGLIVVNTNPLYTEEEMLNQFNEAGVKGLLILANMASKAELIIHKTEIKTLIITELADLHPAPKRWIINAVLKYIKKLVPAYKFADAFTLRDVLSQGKGLSLDRANPTIEDVAVLQFTGGTTGISKGAMLTHGNLIANMQQNRHLLRDLPIQGQHQIIAPLPLYHIYAFLMHCMIAMESGSNSILIANPRDIPGFIKELKNNPFNVFVGLNTLFVALMNHPEFESVDFSKLCFTISGGMALTKQTASDWHQKTSCAITEGYGLTETSPVVCVNPREAEQIGTIGLPVADTEIQIIDEDGQSLAPGEIGELLVRGPQVMKGYWNRPEETAQVLSDAGWLKTGDIAVVQEDGYLRIVDRSKDMILVSGFNVYPNELEDTLAKHPKVIESAAVGIPHPASGEVVKMYVVKREDSLTEEDLISFMRQHLTAYKIPKTIEFRNELPKSPVGKILRRMLRDAN